MRRLRSVLLPCLMIVLSLAVGIPLGGCDRVFGLNRIEPPDGPGEDNGYTCTCNCTYRDGGVSSLPLSVCVQDDLNPNKTGGSTPTAQQLADDCTDRVQVQVQRLSNQCFNPNPSCECVVDPTPDTFFDASCDQGCVTMALASDCSNWDPANGIKGANCGGPQLCLDPGPVCLRQGTDPPVPVPSPLAAGIMAQNTLCRLDEGDSRAIVGAGDRSDTSPLRGVINFAPAPPGTCAPGETCLNMDYRFDTTQTLHFDGFLGIFGDTDLTNIKTLGASVPFALPSSGFAFLAADTTQTSGRGKENGDRRAAFGSNASQLVVGFDGGTCTIQGDLLAGVGDPDGDNDQASLLVRAVGVVENTPPVASVGPDRSVECTSPTGADVELDASDSSDLENDIVGFAWFRGARGGDDLGSGPEITVAQALGAATYVVTVVDSYMQADAAETTVTVADTTGPSIDCNAPATITPRRTPYVFGATTNDVCDDALAAPAVLDYECFTVNKAGKSVARKCVVASAGDTLTILDSGGVGDHFRWRVGASDAHGNGTIVTCETEVVRPGPGPN